MAIKITAATTHSVRGFQWEAACKSAWRHQNLSLASQNVRTVSQRRIYDSVATSSTLCTQPLSRCRSPRLHVLTYSHRGCYIQSVFTIPLLQHVLAKHSHKTLIWSDNVKPYIYCLHH